MYKDGEPARRNGTYKTTTRRAVCPGCIQGNCLRDFGPLERRFIQRRSSSALMRRFGSLRRLPVQCRFALHLRIKPGGEWVESRAASNRRFTPSFFESALLSSMPYPEAMVQPMRQELTQLGVEELQTADAVDAAFDAALDGTMLLVINSVCGCAAGNARPAVSMALQHETQPDQSVTVFAGQDLEATERAREYLVGIPPSSPFIAVLRHGDPVYVIERKHIEGRNASAIASDLTEAFDLYCTDEAPPADAPSGPDVQQSTPGNLPPTFRSFN